MPQAQDASAYVYQGLWINWTKGKPLGATLTLSPKNATVLISIVAIFVQLSGTQLWKISQFVLHQLRATPEGRDGLYHQQQVILRNGAAEISALWQLVRVGFAWRHQKNARSYRRSLALITWAFLHFAAFNLAGIFSARLLNAGDEVLSRSPFCGDYNATYWDSMGTTDVIGMPNHVAVEYYANSQAHYQQSQQYVQFCSNPSEACKVLPQERLPWNWTVQEHCPFDPQVCSPDINKSIVLDTGLISSHRHLGLNAPEADRIQYRKVTTCTFLNDARFISNWKDLPATAKSPAKRVVDAYYGPNPIADRNATYSFSEWSQYYSFDQYSDTNPYQINVQLASAGDLTGEMSDFIPIPELARSDADAMLVFLSFSKTYESPVSDPWYFAQKPQAFPTPDNVGPVNGTVYTRERPVTTLACAEQHQLCIRSDSPSVFPGPKRCTPLSGWSQTATGPDSVDALNLSARQVATATRVLQSAIDSSFYSVIHGLAQRDAPLLARRSIQGLIGLRLPDDQWQQEILYWSSIAMTNLQRAVVDYSTGQFAADTAYINVTSSPQEYWLCQNQIIRGTAYQSFDFFTLVLVLVFGVLIIVAGSTMEDCLALWRKQERRRGQGSFRRDMWAKNEMLEMLRMLCERRGRMVWSHSSNGIPVSAPGQVMKIAELRACSHHKIQPHHQQQEQKPQPAGEESCRSTLTTSSSSDPPRSAQRGPEMVNVSETETLGLEANETEAVADYYEMEVVGPRRADGRRSPYGHGCDRDRERGKETEGEREGERKGENETSPSFLWGERPRTPPPPPRRRPLDWYGLAY